MLQTKSKEKVDGIEKRVIGSLKSWARGRGFPTDITINTDFAKDKGYSLDSLEIVNLSLSLGEDFGIEIPDEDTEKFICSGNGEYGAMSQSVYSAQVRKIVDYISERLKE